MMVKTRVIIAGAEVYQASWRRRMHKLAFRATMTNLAIVAGAIVKSKAP